MNHLHFSAGNNIQENFEASDTDFASVRRYPSHFFWQGTELMSTLTPPLPDDEGNGVSFASGTRLISPKATTTAFAVQYFPERYCQKDLNHYRFIECIHVATLQ